MNTNQKTSQKNLTPANAPGGVADAKAAIAGKPAPAATATVPAPIANFPQPAAAEGRKGRPEGWKASFKVTADNLKTGTGKTPSNAELATVFGILHGLGYKHGESEEKELTPAEVRANLAALSDEDIMDPSKLKKARYTVTMDSKPLPDWFAMKDLKGLTFQRADIAKLFNGFRDKVINTLEGVAEKE